jgi:hypothetical protein
MTNFRPVWRGSGDTPHLPTTRYGIWKHNELLSAANNRKLLCAGPLLAISEAITHRSWHSPGSPASCKTRCINEVAEAIYLAQHDDRHKRRLLLYR